MRIPILAFFLVLVPSCTDEISEPALSSTPTVNLVPGAERIGMSLASLSSALEDHRQAVLRVTDLGALDALEHEYHRATGRYVYHVWDELDGLQACRDIDRQPPNLEGLTDLRDAMLDETDRHRLAVAAAPDVMTAWLDEARHQSAVRAMVEHATEAAMALRDRAVGFACR